MTFLLFKNHSVFGGARAGGIEGWFWCLKVVGGFGEGDGTEVRGGNGGGGSD
jgi:hypothetical protein